MAFTWTGLSGGNVARSTAPVSDSSSSSLARRTTRLLSGMTTEMVARPRAFVDFTGRMSREAFKWRWYNRSSMSRLAQRRVMSDGVVTLARNHEGAGLPPGRP